MSSRHPFIRPSKHGTLLELHVQPRASRDRISGLHGDRLKLTVKAPPSEGRANRACQEFLSKILKLPKSRLVLVRGASSRHKTFLIQDTRPEYVASRLRA